MIWPNGRRLIEPSFQPTIGTRDIRIGKTPRSLTSQTELGTPLMPRPFQIALVVLVTLVLNTNLPAAVLLNFGGYTWDQANVPNTGIKLGVDDPPTRSGATFGPAQPATNLTRTNNINGFVEGQV